MGKKRKKKKKLKIRNPLYEFLRKLPSGPTIDKRRKKEKYKPNYMEE